MQVPTLCSCLPSWISLPDISQLGLYSDKAQCLKTETAGLPHIVFYPGISWLGTRES